MTLPSACTTNNLDSSSDDPAQARAELLTGLQNVNAIVTHLQTSSLTSGASVAAATGGLEVSGTDIRAAFSFLAKTAGYTAVAADRGRVINFTTAGATLALTAAATLGDGWSCFVANTAATGIVTIDPNGTELIDGQTTIQLAPGEALAILCNGTLFRTVGQKLASYFSAHKNGTNQGSITNATETKVTFTTEEADTAAAYDSTNSKFIPPTGQVWLINACIAFTDAGDGEGMSAVLYKNGSAYRRGSREVSGGTQPHGSTVAGVTVVGNGTDYYEIYAQLNNSSGGASRTVNGSSVETWFSATRIG